jgi:hypothetical protein
MSQPDRQQAAFGFRMPLPEYGSGGGTPGRLPPQLAPASGAGCFYVEMGAGGRGHGSGVRGQHVDT